VSQSLEARADFASSLFLDTLLVMLRLSIAVVLLSCAGSSGTKNTEALKVDNRSHQTAKDVLPVNKPSPQAFDLTTQCEANGFVKHENILDLTSVGAFVLLHSQDKNDHSGPKTSNETNNGIKSSLSKHCKNEGYENADELRKGLRPNYEIQDGVSEDGSPTLTIFPSKSAGPRWTKDD
jgi:hypothetical protein